MVERAILMSRGRVVMPGHFPAGTLEVHANSSNGSKPEFLALPFHRALAELERLLIEKALRESGGNKTDAANRLQINRRLLYNKMEEHKIKDSE
jgi:two-component system NtrC family response regulator